MLALLIAASQLAQTHVMPVTELSALRIGMVAESARVRIHGVCKADTLFPESAKQTCTGKASVFGHKAQVLLYVREGILDDALAIIEVKDAPALYEQLEKAKASIWGPPQQATGEGSSRMARWIREDAVYTVHLPQPGRVLVHLGRVEDGTAGDK